MAETVQTKHLELITKEIKSMRGWLEFLERHIEEVKKHGGVIPAITLTSINESSNKLVYNAAIINGAALGKYDTPVTDDQDKVKVNYERD